MRITIKNNHPKHVQITVGNSTCHPITIFANPGETAEADITSSQAVAIFRLLENNPEINKDLEVSLV